MNDLNFACPHWYSPARETLTPAPLLPGSLFSASPLWFKKKKKWRHSFSRLSGWQGSVQRQGCGWVLWEPGVSTSLWCWWVCGGEAGGELFLLNWVPFSVWGWHPSPRVCPPGAPKADKLGWIGAYWGPVGARELPAQLDFVLYKVTFCL